MPTVLIRRYRQPARRVIAAYRIDGHPVAVLSCGHRPQQPWRFDTYHRCRDCDREQKEALDRLRRSRVG